MKRILTAVMSVCLLIGMSGCKAEETAAPELLEPVNVKMDMAQVQRGSIAKVETYSGELVPETEEVYFLVDGRIGEMYAEPGDYVEEGDVLASLDVEQTIEQIEALKKEISKVISEGEYSDRLADLDIEIAREELALMQENLIHTKTCWLKEVEIQRLELSLQQERELREVELAKLRSTLAGLEERVEKSEITAPCSGRVVYAGDLQEGTAVQGYTPVYYIADESRIRLTTDYISEIEIGEADRICARIGDQEYEISYVPFEKGELLQMTLAGEEIKTYFSVEAADAALQSGQYAVILIYNSSRENVLTIPVNALYQDVGGKYVYKDVDGVRVRCDVKVGVTTTTKVEIVEGLEEGDMVYVKD